MNTKLFAIMLAGLIAMPLCAGDNVYMVQPTSADRYPASTDRYVKLLGMAAAVAGAGYASGYACSKMVLPRDLLCLWIWGLAEKGISTPAFKSLQDEGFECNPYAMSLIFWVASWTGFILQQ